MPQESKVLAVRISTTQDSILRTPKYKNRKAAIVRALLTLYLNGRLAMESVERQILVESEAAILRDNKTKSKI